MTDEQLECLTGEVVRHRDVSGVSGTGVVAQVVKLGNGKFVLGWLGKHPSTTIWDTLEGIFAVHGHDGATVIHWANGQVQTRAAKEDEACQGSE
ncbi:hypothetical protein ACXJJ3_08905 [Kribbella sp. WER1]|uniref:hypothetical protein n=1 Tax=Kribbella sp. NPDC059898 TaxID=3346995 RepID=UPI00364ECA25